MMMRLRGCPHLWCWLLPVHASEKKLFVHLADRLSVISHSMDDNPGFAHLLISFFDLATFGYAVLWRIRE
ncbi:hypothetical protein BJX70DRAFT_210228 [Aspergillus crustosus]